MIIFILFLAVTPVQAAEIPLDHWAAVDMLELEARGVLAGEKIEPEAYVTRAEFTRMIVTGLGLKLEALRLQGAPSPFHDVPNSHPLKGYINAAKERGLVGGYTAEIFRPEEELPRAQMIVLLLRVMGIDQLEGNKENLSFKDVDAIPDYALPSINEGVRLGLVAGYGDNTFRPADKVTVSEAAAFINRWLDLKGDRYDYHGQYKTVDLERKLLFIEVNRSLISLPIADNLRLIAGDSPVSWTDLKIDQPIAVKLNILGQAVFLQQKDIELSDIKISLDVRKLPKLHEDYSQSTEFTSHQSPATNDSTSHQLLVTSHQSPVTKEATSHQSLVTSNLFNPRLPMDLDNIQKSLAITKAEINLPSLQSVAGTDGTGKVIAIIDTGVDPSHPDLALTTGGRSKIVDWVDFTLEGLVNTSLVPKAEGQTKVSLQGKEYNLGDIPSKSGLFRLGLISADDVAPLDLVEYGQSPVNIAVLLTDSSEAGLYDTVYIDTNLDNTFMDEKALRIYRRSKEYAMLSFKGKDLALVVADIDPAGRYIQLANDISGHGTHVAGIIAANGALKGMAPGAELMVLKAVDRDGFANPENIVEAIRYAALHGANIINISLGQYQDVKPGQSDLALIVNEVVEKYGVVVVTAAGNIGPGINTVAAPADANSAISVGAFVSPRMWEADFGYQVGQDSLYYFSSIGPRRDGAWYPTIIAPGSAVSTVPSWMEHPYMLTEGTSMAAPHVSGIIANLLEAGDKLGIKTTPAFIKRVIEEGARDLPSFNSIEDGHGVLDAYKAWQKMKNLKEERTLSGTLYSPEYGSGPGVFAREYVPQRLMLRLTNHDNKDYHLEWSASADWLKSELKTTHVLRGGQREIPILFDLQEKAGLYSAVLKGDDPDIPGIEIEIPVNIVIGEKIYKQRPYVYTAMGSLDPGQFARYFITVPDGTNYLNAELEIFPNTSGSYEGRGRLHLIDPFGFEEDMSDYAGLAPYALGRKNKAEAMAFVPEPGTWEVVVYSSASLSIYNSKATKYQLTVDLGDVVNIGSSVLRPDLDLAFSPIPQAVLKKTKGTVILHIWDREKSAPYNGALEINGKFYEIENGRVEYDVNKIKSEMRLRLTILK
ncbi:MAG: hypothetical protein JM58_08400 [Peptococcaceae bacterium BICA1-8]|nr:MAG: hypothetical protein JM58_08400 [Peptococcaceae bacterium BICA1-8]